MVIHWQVGILIEPYSEGVKGARAINSTIRIFMIFRERASRSSLNMKRISSVRLHIPWGLLSYAGLIKILCDENLFDDRKSHLGRRRDIGQDPFQNKDRRSGNRDPHYHWLHQRLSSWTLFNNLWCIIQWQIWHLFIIDVSCLMRNERCQIWIACFTIRAWCWVIITSHTWGTFY